MQKFKIILKKLFFLPPVLTLLIAVPSYGLVIYALAGENVKPAVAYIAYFLSAYALCITVTGAAGIIHWMRLGIKNHPLAKKLLAIPTARRYLEEDVFRAEISLYLGFVINLLYAGIKMVSGVCYKSVWFVTLAVYYILLAVMRFLLLHHVRGREKKGDSKAAQWRRYRLCGIILLLMNWALAGIVILVVHQNSGFVYPGMLIYVMAMYTFYATITAVMNLIKFRKYGSPVWSAAKVINLTAALVSMLSLETAMLTQFGGEEPVFRKIMLASTGLAVSVIVLGLAFYMITHATKILRRQYKTQKGKGDPV